MENVLIATTAIAFGAAFFGVVFAALAIKRIRASKQMRFLDRWIEKVDSDQ